MLRVCVIACVHLCVLLQACWSQDNKTTAAADTGDLQAIGGKWFVKAGDKPLYYYRDAGRMLDLFSYHMQDANKDGVDNIRVSHDKNFIIIHSQGFPNHPTAIFPNANNPNSILVQDFTFRIPLEPKLSGKITRLPMGPIGTALNGVVYFNPFEAEGMNAVEGYSEVWLDSCCGHPTNNGTYHYHKYPSCVKSPFSDDGTQHSPIIGFAFDGFPLYGPYESDNVMARDLKGNQALDVCNGHTDNERGYHYHVTPGRFPYIMGGYAGVVERSNSHALGRVSEGPIEANIQAGENRMDKVIAAVRPGLAERGKRHTLQIELSPEKGQRRRVPDGEPSWVQIGPFEATKITRMGNLVTIEIDIPQDANVGHFLDCHVEFENSQGRGGPITYKLNDAFRVVHR
jgi:hypothetical protein